jgi:hypothetical protein
VGGQARGRYAKRLPMRLSKTETGLPRRRSAGARCSGAFPGPWPGKLNSAERALSQPTANHDSVRRFIQQMPPAVSPRMFSWEIPEREPVAWSKSPNPARNHPLVAHILTTRGGSERAANDLRQAVRTGLGNGNYTLLFLWIKFWSYGGDARMTELGAFIRGSQELSNIDAIVLGFVVDELHEPWRKAIRTLHRRATGSSRPPPQRPQRR